MIDETATATAVLRETATTTERRETAILTAATRTEDPATETLTDRRVGTATLTDVVTVTSTEGHATTTDGIGTLTVRRRETGTWTATAAGSGTGTLTAPVREIVRGILTDRVNPTTGLHATTDMTIGDETTAAGPESESEIGVLMSVVHLPAMTGEAKVGLVFQHWVIS